MAAASSSPSSSSIVAASPLLAASLGLNLAVLVFWASRYDGAGTPPTSVEETSWTRTAAMEAEAASAFNCSGNGVSYSELLFGSLSSPPASSSSSSSSSSCECDECFTGPHCEHPVPDCLVAADSGDPLMFVPYWRDNEEASAILIPGWYRAGYDLSTTITPALEEEIRAMHRLVGNAVTEGRYIVVGAGEMQLVMAAYMAFSMEAQGAPLNVFSAPPYYDAFERQVKVTKPGTAVWSMPSSSTDGKSLEIVISPNNPDGSLREKTTDDAEAWAIYDHAYYWPHYVPITKALDHDFMMFTLSKLTGHAGSRVGWAIIKDFAMYEKIILAVRLMTVKVSHESQLRAAHLLRTVREGYENRGNTVRQHIFHYGHSKLSERWGRMIELFRGSDRFVIDQHFEPRRCNFLKEIVKPTPAFVWIRCVKEEEDRSCPDIFKEAGVMGRGGARCGATDQHVRFAMLGTDSSFEAMIDRIQTRVVNS